MRNMREFGWTVAMGLVGVAIASGGGIAWAGDSVERGQPTAEAQSAAPRDGVEGPSVPRPAWDDSHMRSRFPTRDEANAGRPRLILPEGSETQPIADGKTIYATPDRNWKSGHGTRGARTSRRPGSTGFTLGGMNVRGVGSQRGTPSLRSSTLRGAARGRRR